jgi:hypothetical protein
VPFAINGIVVVVRWDLGGVAMALLAEQLVDEWLNRTGFFTLRGIKSGVHEIDLLGVRMSKGRLEGWHVECQVSFRPISYVGKLSKERQQEIGAKSATPQQKSGPRTLLRQT